MYKNQLSKIMSYVYDDNKKTWSSPVKFLYKILYLYLYQIMKTCRKIIDCTKLNKV